MKQCVRGKLARFLWTVDQTAGLLLNKTKCDHTSIPLAQFELSTADIEQLKQYAPLFRHLLVSFPVLW